MSRRTERVGSVIQEVIGRLLLARFADPRVDPARTSVTSVDVPEDFLTAKVYVSVMGTEAQQRNALRALRHARGYFQQRLGRELHMRHTPALQFELDVKFKKTLETLTIIQQAMDEIHSKEAATEADDEDQR